MLSPNGPADEHTGDVLALSVAWGGNTRIDLDVRPTAEPGAPRQLRLRAGANPYAADYVLDPGGPVRDAHGGMDLVGLGTPRGHPALP